MKEKIFILSHKQIPAVFPHRDSYVYLQCGSKDNRLSGFSLFDDADNVISDLNWCFSEATGINYVIQNPAVFEDVDFVGFGQYRRYLNYDSANLKNGHIYCSEMKLRNFVLMQYAQCHPLDAYVLFMRRIFKENPDLFKAIHKYFKVSKSIYRANCFITSNDIFQKYRQFIANLIPIMADIVRWEIDCSRYIAYQKRYMGFLFERLTSFWIHSMQENGIKTVDIPLIDLDVENKENGTR